MDPIGFALENFDAIGKWRTEDGGDPDRCVRRAGGRHEDGRRRPALRDVADALLRQFVRVVTEKLLTYALGRGVEYYDMPLVRSIVRDAAPDNYRFSSLVLGIVEERAVSDEHRRQQVPGSVRSHGN